MLDNLTESCNSTIPSILVVEVEGLKIRTTVTLPQNFKNKISATGMRKRSHHKTNNFLADSPRLPMVRLRIFLTLQWCKRDMHSVENVL